jgi:hypothetical protein
MFASQKSVKIRGETRADFDFPLRDDNEAAAATACAQYRTARDGKQERIKRASSRS